MNTRRLVPAVCCAFVSLAPLHACAAVVEDFESGSLSNWTACNAWTITSPGHNSNFAVRTSGLGCCGASADHRLTHNSFSGSFGRYEYDVLLPSPGSIDNGDLYIQFQPSPATYLWFEFGPIGGDNSFDFISFVGNSCTTTGIASTPIHLTAGMWHTIAIERYPNGVIRVYTDGTLKMEGYEPTLTSAGTIALAAHSDGVLYDNITFDATLPPDPPVPPQGALFCAAPYVGCPTCTPGPPAPPPAPTSCSAADNAHPSIAVTWSQVPCETGYRLYRNGSLAATLGANVTSTTDTPPASGFYTYCVEAFNSGGASDTTCDLGSRVPYAGHAYSVVVDPSASWQQASNAAQSAGGNLATITSADEQGFIEQLMARSSLPTYGALWLGLTEAAEGVWGWYTNEPYTYQNWAPNEPNNSGGVEDRGHIYWSDISDRNFRWNDVPGNGYPPGSGDVSRLGYIIETGAPVQPPPASPGPCVATDSNTNGVTVTWANVADEDGYRVYRNGSLIATPLANEVSYIDVPPHGTYTYCVEAYNSFGASAQACDSGTRPSPPVGAPIAGVPSIIMILLSLGCAGSYCAARRR